VGHRNHSTWRKLKPDSVQFARNISLPLLYSWSSEYEWNDRSRCGITITISITEPERERERDSDTESVNYLSSDQSTEEIKRRNKL
jgi:hypothetical protein